MNGHTKKHPKRTFRFFSADPRLPSNLGVLGTARADLRFSGQMKEPSGDRCVMEQAQVGDDDFNATSVGCCLP